MSADDIHNTVCADRTRVFIVETNTGPNARSNNQRADMKITLAHLAQRNNERRHYGRDDDCFNIRHADPLIVKQFVDQYAVLIACLLPICRDAPMPQQLSPVVGAHDNIAVADIQY